MKQGMELQVGGEREKGKHRLWGAKEKKKERVLSFFLSSE